MKLRGRGPLRRSGRAERLLRPWLPRGVRTLRVDRLLSMKGDRQAVSISAAANLEVAPSPTHEEYVLWRRLLRPGV